MRQTTNALHCRPTLSAQRAPLGPSTPRQTVDEDDDDNNFEDETPPAASAPPKRKSRVLRRKTDHSVIERRRREKINERLIRLQEMVPACREEALELLEKKPPKAARGPKVDVETKQKEILKHMSDSMVLEKLCIISHAVGGYVRVSHDVHEHLLTFMASQTISTSCAQA